MFRKSIIIAVVIAMTGILLFGAVSYSQAKTGNEITDLYSSRQSNTSNAAPGNGGIGSPGGAGSAANYSGGLVNLPGASGDLNAEEAAALLYMREEEKLAHDVYVTLYNQWGLAIFQNIANSEQTHTSAIKTLIERYGLVDPASTQVGVFSDPALQELYTTLVARGSQSLAEALKVGTAIEEIDILDLEKHLAETDQADIQQVYQNLLRGSGSHLRAFVSTLQAQTSETYQPQYLSQSAYQAILGSTNGKGGQGQTASGGRGRSGRP
jgi:hypothetical protein